MKAQNCLSEALHPWAIYVSVSLSEGQARLRLQWRVEQPRFGFCIFWKLKASLSSFTSESKSERVGSMERHTSRQTSLLWIDYCSPPSSFELILFGRIMCNTAQLSKQNKNLRSLSGHEHKQPNRAEEETEVPATESALRKERKKPIPSPFRVQRKNFIFKGIRSNTLKSSFFLSIRQLL